VTARLLSIKLMKPGTPNDRMTAATVIVNNNSSSVNPFCLSSLTTTFSSFRSLAISNEDAYCRRGVEAAVSGIADPERPPSSSDERFIRRDGRSGLVAFERFVRQLWQIAASSRGPQV
jgi:hypothetical protein